jgi:GR25 family glycosyltransferase involved in LPS biosynthesis
MNDIVNYFIIHCEQHIEREHHIKKLVKLFNDKITIFKGYYTKNISIDYNNKINYFKSIDKNMNMKINVLSKSGEIGCYLSHHMLIKYIHENCNKDNYSVIFEDDVVLNENIDEDIKEIILNLINEKLDWDLVFLGNLTMNHKKLIKNNIYTIDKNNCCTGTHALLINNKNIEKIYNSNCDIIHAIDWQYKINIDNKNLNGYAIFPPLCNQNTEFLSNIQ